MRIVASRPAWSRRRLPRQWLTAYSFILPFALLFLLFFLVPIGFAFVQSLHQSKRSGLGLEAPRELFTGLANYTLAWHDHTFFDGIGRVLLYGAVNIPLILGLALVFALALDSATLRFKRFFRLAFFLPYAVPGVIAALLWGFLYDPSLSPIVQGFAHTRLGAPDFLGPQSVLWSINNISVWEWTGYNMIILYAALQAIPQELYEAARIDGATDWAIAWRVKVPMIAPALVLVFLFSIIGTLQLFNEPQVLATISHSISSSYTPNLYSYTTAFAKGNYDYAATLAVVLAVITFILSFGFLRLTRNQSGV